MEWSDRPKEKLERRRREGGKLESSAGEGPREALRAVRRGSLYVCLAVPRSRKALHDVNIGLWTYDLGESERPAINSQSQSQLTAMKDVTRARRAERRQALPVHNSRDRSKLVGMYSGRVQIRRECTVGAKAGYEQSVKRVQ